MARAHWLIKSEPYKYSFAELVKDRRTMWDGVRNFEARNNLRAMKVDDLALFYHSNEGKAVVGIARIIKEAYPDPTAPGEDWSVVDVAPLAPMKQHVPLDLIKSDAVLATMALLKRSRLSVVPVEKDHFDYILKLGKTPASALKKPTKRAPAAKKDPAAGSSQGGAAKSGRAAKAPTSPSRAAKAPASAAPAGKKQSAKARPPAPRQKKNA